MEAALVLPLTLFRDRNRAGAYASVLLIGIANLISVQTVRNAARGHEMVLRAALERLKYRPYTVRDIDRTPMTEYQGLLITRGDRDTTPASSTTPSPSALRAQQSARSSTSQPPVESSTD